MQQQFLTIWDVVLSPVYLIPLSYLARRHRDKHYPKGHPLRRYYLPGLYVKFGGAIFIALVYQYYYGFGDTFNYFLHSQVINSALDDSFMNWLQLLLRTSPDTNIQLYPYSSQMEWYRDPPTYSVAVIGALFGLLNNTSYIPIALLFAFFSYTGIWAMYRTFATLYPGLHKQLAIAFLFVPSTFVWGSAIFKDTVCMFGLGWMTYTTFRLFSHRDFSIKNILLLVLGFYLVALIKIYILLAFIPALCFWILLTYSGKIRHVAVRWILNLASVGITLLGFAFFSQRFSQELNRYSLESLTNTSVATRQWITYASGEEGSAYDLGQMEPTLTGLLSKFPAGVAVTLYRPFPWEVKKPIMALSALEALAFLGLTLMVFFRNGFFNAIRRVFTDANLLFFFVFSITFAFAVGISTGNFGTLSRYKIPCMPFFAAMLLILYYQSSLAVKANMHVFTKKRVVHHLS